MRLPRGPGFVSLAGVRPSPGGKDCPALAVGSRAIVKGANGGGRVVTLTDDSGSNPVGTLGEGVEVEVLAWRPRRGGDTRYRVVPTSGGTEGWLSASSLAPRPVPAAPERVVAPAARATLPPPAARVETARPPRPATRKAGERSPVARKRSRGG